MIQKALEYIVGLKEARLVNINGTEFSDKQLYPVKTPDFPTLKVNTLTSIIDYLKGIGNEKWNEGNDPIIVHIVDEKTVCLRDTADAYEGKRDIFMIAEAEVPKFEYGKFYDSENFNIAMQSKFMDNEDKATILQVVGNLRDEAVRTMVDDGVSQVTSIRTGVAQVEDVKIPNPVELKPFRTFLEVEQPESKFIFRMREGGQCGIFEADGGAWKLEAKENIYNFLRDRLQEEMDAGAVVLIV